MSSLTGESSGSTNNDNFELINKFFAETEKNDEAPPPALKKISNFALPRISANFPSKCASWVKDQSFEIRPNEEPSEPVECVGSPLPESVTSWSGFQANLRKKRKKTEENLERNEERKRKSGPIPPPPPTSFFKQFEAKLAETHKNIRENPENWTKIGGILVEKSKISMEESEISSDGPNSKFTEITALFNSNNSTIYHSLDFDNRYTFDWGLFDKEGYQYVVFTKVCQSHPPGEFVEMRKEDKRCSECNSSNLAITVRLTVPLDLSTVPIPIFENIQIHVSFRTAHLLEKSGIESMEFMEKSVDFSPKTCQKMWIFFQKMCEERKMSWEYKKWFDRSKQFVKTTLGSKSLSLLHGRVIRRKTEEIMDDSKKRCHIFADIFNLYDSE